MSNTGPKIRAGALFVSDRLQDLSHLHGIAGRNLVKRKSELIPSNPCQAGMTF
jgi:hypothetical protein